MRVGVGVKASGRYEKGNAWPERQDLRGGKRPIQEVLHHVERASGTID